MIKRMICIECPKGCELAVEMDGGKISKVTGAKCPKGIVYAAAEAEDPKRILTATVLAEGLDIKLVPVRTDKPIPKRDLMRAMEEIAKLRVSRPIACGVVVAENFLDLGVNLIATRRVS